MRCCNPTLPTSKPRPLVCNQGTSSQKHLTSSQLKKGNVDSTQVAAYGLLGVRASYLDRSGPPTPPRHVSERTGALFSDGRLVDVTLTLSGISCFCQAELNNSFHKLSERRPEAHNRKLRYEFQSVHQ